MFDCLTAQRGSSARGHDCYFALFLIEFIIEWWTKYSEDLPFICVAVVLFRERADGVTASENTRLADAGVTRPLEYGVYRIEFDGVMRPEE